MNKKTIVVIGANGRQGQAAIGKLLDEGFRIRALVRNSAKASDLLKHELVEIVEGDLSKPDTLEQLFDNAYGLFMVLPYGPEALSYANRLLDMAKNSQLQHIVYTSVGGVDRNQGIPHFRDKKTIEDQLKTLAIPYTILRPAGYMDQLAHPSSIRFMLGMLRLYLSDQQTFQLISVEGIGYFVAQAFVNKPQFESQELEIAGDEVSIGKILQTIEAEMNLKLKPYPLPGFFKWFMPSIARQMFQFYADDGWQADVSKLKQIHPGLQGFQQWLTDSHLYD